MSSRPRARALVWMLLGLALLPACSRKPAPKQYPLEGQILAVAPATLQVTIKHHDVEGLMPGMTMTFPVTNAAVLEGHTAGELITATLEVDDAVGRIVAMTRVGSAPLPDTNEVGLATSMLEVGSEVPDAALIDQANHRRSLSEWRGAYALMTFIYTRCPLPNYCPLMDQNFRTMQRELARDARLTGRVKLVSISFDPEHDTPEVLAAHAARLEADPAVWTFLTGDRVVTDRVAARFGVGVIRSPDDPTQITHNLATVLIGPDGRLLHVYPGNDWTPNTILADLRAAIRTP